MLSLQKLHQYMKLENKMQTKQNIYVKRNMKSFSNETLTLFFFFKRFCFSYILNLAKTVWALWILPQKFSRNFVIKELVNLCCKICSFFLCIPAYLVFKFKLSVIDPLAFLCSETELQKKIREYEKDLTSRDLKHKFEHYKGLFKFVKLYVKILAILP